MGTITSEQARYEFTFIQSNNGVHLEFEGEEVLRFWPKTGEYAAVIPGESEVPEALQSITNLVSPDTIVAATAKAKDGDKQLLAPGE